MSKLSFLEQLVGGDPFSKLSVGWRSDIANAVRNSIINVSYLDYSSGSDLLKERERHEREIGRVRQIMISGSIEDFAFEEIGYSLSEILSNAVVVTLASKGAFVDTESYLKEFRKILSKTTESIIKELDGTFPEIAINSIYDFNAILQHGRQEVSGPYRGLLQLDAAHTLLLAKYFNFLLDIEQKKANGHQKAKTAIDYLGETLIDHLRINRIVEYGSIIDTERKDIVMNRKYVKGIEDKDTPQYIFFINEGIEANNAYMLAASHDVNQRKDLKKIADTFKYLTRVGLLRPVEAILFLTNSGVMLSQDYMALLESYKALKNNGVRPEHAIILVGSLQLGVSDVERVFDSYKQSGLKNTLTKCYEDSAGIRGRGFAN